MGKRYMLPEGCHLDGVRLVEGDEDGATGLWLVAGPMGTQAYFDRDLLAEVPPPMPDEPGPGAYLIGGQLCVRWDDGEDEYRWHSSRLKQYPWRSFWENLGGTGVQIVPLGPKLPAAKVA